MNELPEESVIHKRSARGIVRDPKGRILLLNWRDPKNGREVWEVPGGSVERNETLEEALVRELREETGYINIQVGKPVWTRSHSFSWAEQEYSADETFFLCNLLTEDCVPVSHDEVESAGYIGRKWWVASELPSTDETFIPPDLGLRLQALQEEQST